MSFFEVTMEWKGDLWATKLILESDTRDADNPLGPGAEGLPKPLEEPQGPAKDQNKQDAKKEMNDLKKAVGTWKLAPTMVTERSIWTLDMLLLVCRATWKCHAERARNIVTPNQVLENNLACCRANFWAFELEEMVSSSLWRG